MRRLLVLLVLIVAVAAWLWSWNRPSAVAVTPLPVLSLSTLQMLPDQDVDMQVVQHLDALFHHPVHAARSWRDCSEAVRHMWAMSSIERMTSDFGVAGAIALQQARPEVPTIAEALAAYVALGLTDAANALQEAVRRAETDNQMSNAAWNRFASVLSRPETRTRRLTFLKQHLGAFVAPWPEP